MSNPARREILMNSRPHAISLSPLVGAINGRWAPSLLPVARILCDSESISMKPSELSLDSDTSSMMIFAILLRSPYLAPGVYRKKENPCSKAINQSERQIAEVHLQKLQGFHVQSRRLLPQGLLFLCGPNDPTDPCPNQGQIGQPHVSQIL